MKTMRMILAILLIAGGGFALSAAQAQQGQEMTGIKRTDLRLFYKFDGINCCPKLNAKLVNRLIHRWRQVPPPINSVAHRFFGGCYHLINGDITVGLRHSIASLFRAGTETTAFAAVRRSCAPTVTISLTSWPESGSLALIPLGE